MKTPVMVECHPRATSQTFQLRQTGGKTMPLGELRRKDRALGTTESEELLARALVGRLGTVGVDGMPYVVPMNFVYDPRERTVFFHCARSGHRLENLASNPLACFEVDEPGALVASGPFPCDTGQVFKSVICFGRADLVTEPAERERVLRLFTVKYVDRLTPDRRYEPDMPSANSVAIIALHVERMTGKQRRATF